MRVNRRENDGGIFDIWMDEQVYAIHCASLEILARTGFLVHDGEALEHLTAHGAYVDGNRVRLPARMIDRGSTGERAFKNHAVLHRKQG